MAKDLVKSEKNESQKGQVKEKWFKITQEFKRKYIINIGYTAVLVVVLVALFIGINYFVKKLNLPYIDLSADQLFTISDDILADVADIPNDVELICFNMTEEDQIYNFAMQFDRSNDKIHTRFFDEDDDEELTADNPYISQYDGILVKSGDNSTFLYSADMISEDENYNQVYVADQKLCSAIRNVSAIEKPVVYFGKGYSNDLTYSELISFVQNEMIDVKEMNLINDNTIPEDCKLLIIETPVLMDFTDHTMDMLKTYMENEGNILWLQGIVSEEQNFKNVNDFLYLYGFFPFTAGYISERDSDMMYYSSSQIFFANLTQDTVFTANISGTPKLLLPYATKINIASIVQEAEVTTIGTTSTNAVFINETETLPTEEGFTIAAISEREIDTGKYSYMCVVGNSFFASDQPLNSYQSVLYANNKDFLVNTIAFLVEREPTATSAFKTMYNKYTLDNTQLSIVRTVCAMLPITVIVIGVENWIYRRRL